jgi:hypothetical protein
VTFSYKLDHAQHKVEGPQWPVSPLPDRHLGDVVERAVVEPSEAVGVAQPVLHNISG